MTTVWSRIGIALHAEYEAQDLLDEFSQADVGNWARVLDETREKEERRNSASTPPILSSPDPQYDA
jgi:hypothetical protein